MTNANIYTAADQYAYRPEDERFSSLAALIQDAATDRDQCGEAVYNLRDLRAVPVRTKDTTDPRSYDGLRLASPNGEAAFTHYSFGQLVKSIGGSFPRGTGLLRSLPPAIAADAINYGLNEAAPTGQRANILIRDTDPENPTTVPIIRAATSDTYGRVWDAQLYGEVARHFGDGAKSAAGEWQSPPVWPGAKPGGQYRGDRDSFVIRVDGGSIVDDPRGWNTAGRANGGGLYRGIMIRNSEVGECSITIDCVLFDKICGNHILWGAVIDRTFRRQHRGSRVTQDTMRELITLARKFNQRTASEDARIIKALVDHQIAATKEAVIDELKAMGATKEQATEAYAHAEAAEPTLNPRSFWAIAAGMTRYSQESGYQDDRYALDQLAASILKKGAKQLVTV